jgi:hypothetical protein
MRGPQYDRIAGIFPFEWVPNIGNFARIEHMSLSCEGITGKTVLGSVAMVATAQQITRPYAQGCSSQEAGECCTPFSLTAPGASTPMKT